MHDYLKLDEVARRLDISEKTARRYVKSGTIPSFFVGGQYRISEADLERFVESRRFDPKAEAPFGQAEADTGTAERRFHAGAWIALLEQAARTCERLSSASDPDIDTLADVEVLCMELRGAYSVTVRELVQEWASEVGLSSRLELVDERLRNARRAISGKLQEELKKADAEKVAHIEERRKSAVDLYRETGT